MTTTTPMTLKERAQAEYDFSADLIRKGESIVPHVTAFTADGKIMILGALWSNSQEKDMFIRMCKLFFIAHDVTSYLMTTESWTISQKPGDATPEGSFEHVEGRGEALMIRGFAADDHIWMIGVIEREPEITVTLNETKYETITGRMAESMLPTAEMMQDPNIKANAKAILDALSQVGLGVISANELDTPPVPS